MTIEITVPSDPAETVAEVVGHVDAGQDYVPPTEGERAAAVAGLAKLVLRDVPGARELLVPLGFTVERRVDPVTGRAYGVALSAVTAESATTRPWGLYLVDWSAPLALGLAVPHPHSDAFCEELALRGWRDNPGSLLALAAVHRDAVDKTADHAHNTESVFHHLWTSYLGPRVIPQVQIHGFDNNTAPGQDVVVATGIGPATSAAVRLADELSATGLVTTRSWDGSADRDLRATTNVQGIAAAASGWVWIHVEHSRRVRENQELWVPAVDALTAANVPLLALDRSEPDSVVILADQPQIRIDAAQGRAFRVALAGNRTLAFPTHGRDGQRITVEAMAVDSTPTLRLAPAFATVEGVPRTIEVAAGKRWFGTLLRVDGLGWLVIGSAVQG